MGFNISGLIVNQNLEKKEALESLLKSNIEYQQEIDFEEATGNSREENTVDVLVTSKGTMIITEMGQIYELSDFRGDAIQFMNSDVADTYYFEKFANGVLDRKYIISQGEVAEDFGDGMIDKEEELLDQIWGFATSYLQGNFIEMMFDLKFKRYRLI